MFDNLYGFSCVENQVLAQLRKNGEDISRLYGLSFIKIADIFNYTFSNNGKAEYFMFIPRIQDILKEIGVIRLELKTGEIEKDKTVFVKIQPEFVKEKLLARGLREDHYVLYKNNTVYNDIPQTSAEVEDIYSIYAGSYFVFDQIRKMSNDDLQYFQYNIIYEKFLLPQIDCSEIGIKTRNFLWILKLILYRYAEYFNLYNNTEIDKLFALCEYLNIRKSSDMSKYLNIIQEAVTLYESTIYKKGR